MDPATQQNAAMVEEATAAAANLKSEAHELSGELQIRRARAEPREVSGRFQPR